MPNQWVAATLKITDVSHVAKLTTVYDPDLLGPGSGIVTIDASDTLALPPLPPSIVTGKIEFEWDENSSSWCFKETVDDVVNRDFCGIDSSLSLDPPVDGAGFCFDSISSLYSFAYNWPWLYMQY